MAKLAWIVVIGALGWALGAAVAELPRVVVVPVNGAIGPASEDFVQRVLDTQTDAWGIKVFTVEIKHVDLNESMVRAIARQAEAERERRAKIIHAEGELQAAEKLLQAAQMLSRQPQAMQLRYLQTPGNIAGDRSSTIVFPVPIDILTGLGATRPPDAAK
jgi:energy-converting hydrogenase Eha subunit E